MSTTPVAGVGLTDAFVNSQRRIYMVTGTTTPVVNFIPTVKVSEKPKSNETTWYDSGNIDANGMATENGHITAYAYAYDVETKAFAVVTTTPALLTVIQTILGCKRKGGMNIRFPFIIDQGDGSTPQMANFDVVHPVSVDGDTKDDMPIKFELHQRGPEVANTYSLPLTYDADNAIASVG